MSVYSPAACQLVLTSAPIEGRCQEGTLVGARCRPGLGVGCPSALSAGIGERQRRLGQVAGCRRRRRRSTRSPGAAGVPTRGEAPSPSVPLGRRQRRGHPGSLTPDGTLAHPRRAHPRGTDRAQDRRWRPDHVRRAARASPGGRECPAGQTCGPGGPCRPGAAEPRAGRRTARLPAPGGGGGPHRPAAHRGRAGAAHGARLADPRRAPRRPGGGRRCPRPARDRPGHDGDAHVHVGDHRRAQAGGPELRQLAVERAGFGAGAGPGPRRDVAVPDAAGPRRRPLHPDPLGRLRHHRSAARAL